MTLRCWLLLFAAALPLSAAERPLNVLVLIADDLRNDLGCYGSSEAITPHLDRLAAESVVFDHAYCQQAVCWPSRNSLLSGIRPENLGKTNAEHTFRISHPDQPSLPQWFRQHGYHTSGFGKILHDGQQDDLSWSQPFFTPPPVHYALPENYGKHPVINRAAAENRVNPLFEAADVADTGYEDGLIATAVVRQIRQSATAGTPFFIMAGFHKPHTPFNAPKRYWDLYDPAALSLAANPDAPTDVPAAFAMLDWPYVRSFQGMPESGPMPDDLARQIRHAYLACVSYVDALTGQILDTLRDTDLWDNTVVVFTSDHGYQLGEHGLWCKHTNFELATRVPLIVRLPGQSAAHTQSLTELIDLYPTLADLCHLPPPVTEGISFAPVIHNPRSSHRQTALSSYPRNQARGWSIRTPTHRYTEWRDLKTDDLRATELYDHRTDPGENANLANDPSQKAVINECSALLAKRRQPPAPPPNSSPATEKNQR